MSWILIDDQGEAQTVASDLSKNDFGLKITALSPTDGRAELFENRVRPGGVLMDLDLSGDANERGSGAGIAQDARVKQRAGALEEYPIVRFSAKDRIQATVKGDPGSDDLFDLKIPKEEWPSERISIQHRLVGLEQVYEGLAQHKSPADALPTLTALLGLDEQQLGRWSHQGFHDRLLSALDVATHVAAGTFMRGFLTPTGLLVSEAVLAMRLGVDPITSGAHWIELRDSLPFAYDGIAGDHFERWWARGLDEWWLEQIRATEPLSAHTLEQRVDGLRKLGFAKIKPLTMPQGSAGERPWRPCALNLESDPPVVVPVDPAESVRVTPRADLPAWTDPLYAALGTALQEKDFRLNKADIDRLKRKHVKG